MAVHFDLVNKISLAIVAMSMVYFIVMDVLLYSRVKNYRIRATTNDTPYQPTIPCNLNPLCAVTVKGLTLDHPNHFLLSPLAALMDKILGISQYWNWLTPNMISGFHVLVAVLAGKCVSSESLTQRRLGAILFQVRTQLDDLDGHVARQRANISGERSDVGSPGYFVDGFCDALGCVALITGLYYFLIRSPPRRGGYDKLQILPLTSVILDAPSSSSSFSSNMSIRNIALPNVLLIIGHLIVASAAWNRYIWLYQDLLDLDIEPFSINTELLHLRQTNVLRSNSFWFVALGWKMLNVHAAMDYLLLAIFFNRVWEYIKLSRWSSYVLIFLLIYLTEFHYQYAYDYIHMVPMILGSERSSLIGLNNR